MNQRPVRNDRTTHGPSVSARHVTGDESWARVFWLECERAVLNVRSLLRVVNDVFNQTCVCVRGTVWFRQCINISFNQGDVCAPTPYTLTHTSSQKSSAVWAQTEDNSPTHCQISHHWFRMSRRIKEGVMLSELLARYVSGWQEKITGSCAHRDEMAPKHRTRGTGMTGGGWFVISFSCPLILSPLLPLFHPWLKRRTPCLCHWFGCLSGRWRGSSVKGKDVAIVLSKKRKRKKSAWRTFVRSATIRRCKSGRRKMEHVRKRSQNGMYHEMYDMMKMKPRQRGAKREETVWGQNSSGCPKTHTLAAMLQADTDDGPSFPLRLVRTEYNGAMMRRERRMLGTSKMGDKTEGKNSSPYKNWDEGDIPSSPPPSINSVDVELQPWFNFLHKTQTNASLLLLHHANGLIPLSHWSRKRLLLYSRIKFASFFLPPNNEPVFVTPILDNRVAFSNQSEEKATGGTFGILKESSVSGIEWCILLQSSIRIHSHAFRLTATDAVAIIPRDSCNDSAAPGTRHFITGRIPHDSQWPTAAWHIFLMSACEAGMHFHWHKSPGDWTRQSWCSCRCLPPPLCQHSTRHMITGYCDITFLWSWCPLHSWLPHCRVIRIRTRGRCGHHIRTKVMWPRADRSLPLLHPRRPWTRSHMVSVHVLKSVL